MGRLAEMVQRSLELAGADLEGQRITSLSSSHVRLKCRGGAETSVVYYVLPNKKGSRTVYIINSEIANLTGNAHQTVKSAQFDNTNEPQITELAKPIQDTFCGINCRTECWLKRRRKLT